MIEAPWPTASRDRARAAVGCVEQLAEDGAKPRRCGCPRPVRVVLHVDDLSVLQLEDVRPVVALPVLVRPGEGDDDAGAVLLDGVDAGVVVALLAVPVGR